MDSYAAKRAASELSSLRKLATLLHFTVRAGGTAGAATAQLNDREGQPPMTLRPPIR